MKNDKEQITDIDKTSLSFVARLRCAFKSIFRQSYGAFKVSEDLIPVKGLNEPVRFMHMTDAHVSVVSSDEKEFHQYSKRMDRAFRKVKDHRTKRKSKASEVFLDLLDIAKKENVDVIVLSGDIVNNPSKASVAFVYGALEATGIPYIFIAGNHDWHYEGLEGAANHLRDTWIEKSLKPLYKGQNPLYGSYLHGGLNFVTIDNSTYQVSQDQLDFFKGQVQLNKLMVLILHIPLYTEGDKVYKGI